MAHAFSPELRRQTREDQDGAQGHSGPYETPSLKSILQLQIHLLMAHPLRVCAGSGIEGYEGKAKQCQDGDREGTDIGTLRPMGVMGVSMPRCAGHTLMYIYHTQLTVLTTEWLHCM